MSVQPDLPHKVSQMRHDLDDLYELVSQVERRQKRAESILLRHSNRLDELQQTLDLHGGRLDRIEDSYRRLEDNQQRQFEQLSAQVAEVLGLLRGPATPESER